MIILSCSHEATRDYYLVTTSDEHLTEQGYQPSRLTGCYCKTCYLEMQNNPNYEILEVETLEY